MSGIIFPRLLHVQLEFFTSFKEKHLEAMIGLTKFHLLKPWFVRWLAQWNTCYCMYHMELRYFLDGLNNMRVDKDILHFSCTCTCWGVCRQGCTLSNTCIALTRTYFGLIELCNLVLCSKLDLMPWHDVECLLRICENCGPEKLFHLCPKELSATEALHWKQFGKVSGLSEDGRKRTHIKVEYKEGTPIELIVGLKRSLKFFITHNSFLVHWQNDEFKNQLLELLGDMVLSYVDFNENYTMKVHNKIQTMYYYSTQVTILVMVIY